MLNTREVAPPTPSPLRSESERGPEEVEVDSTTPLAKEIVADPVVGADAEASANGRSRSTSEPNHIRSAVELKPSTSPPSVVGSATGRESNSASIKESPSVVSQSSSSTPHGNNMSATVSAAPSQPAASLPTGSPVVSPNANGVQSPGRDLLVDDHSKNRFTTEEDMEGLCDENPIADASLRQLSASQSSQPNTINFVDASGASRSNVGGPPRRYSIPPRLGSPSSHVALITAVAATTVGGVAPSPSYAPLVRYEEVLEHTPRQQYVLPVSRTTGSRGSSPARQYSDVRSQLIAAERELAEMREESTKRSITMDTLDAALQRERELVQSLRVRHYEESEGMRDEHDAQTRQLREQIRVLKIVAEGAMADKNRVAEEAARSKKELLALLDKDREEKRYILADYREQTEALIAEQGREITTMRVTLDKMKEEYDRLVLEHEAEFTQRGTLAAQLEEVRSASDQERMDSARRLSDLQRRLHEEQESHGEQLSVLQEEQLRAGARAQSKTAELTDEVQRLQEKLAASEEKYTHALEGSRQAHRREAETLQRELAALKTQREESEAENRRAVEAAIRSEASTTESLQRVLETVRQEKEDAVTEGYRQREEMQVLHRAKLTQLQTIVDTLNAEVGQEHSRRKDAEAATEVLRLRMESFQKKAEDFARDAELREEEQRSRERAAEQAHQQALEEIRAKLRTVTSEFAQLQQLHRQQAVEMQRLQGDVEFKRTALEKARTELKDAQAQLAGEMGKQAETHQARAAELERTCEATRTQCHALESERLRLDRALGEAEQKLASLKKQGELERATLTTTSVQLQDAKANIEELTETRVHLQGRLEALEAEHYTVLKGMQMTKLCQAELEATLQAAERRVQESTQDVQRLTSMHESKMHDLSQRHMAELAAVRLSVEQARSDGAKARESLLSRESALQQLREKLSDQHRASAMREGALQEELEDRREAHEAEMRHMDEILNGLRVSLANSQAVSAQCQQELANIHRGASGRHSDLEQALEQSEAARARLQEDGHYREQLNQELQGTVRLLTSRLGSQDEEMHRLQDELVESNRKLQETHTIIGRRDAAIGQLNAKLRAYESRGTLM